MKIWRNDEQAEYPPMALAIASVLTPVQWRTSKVRGWAGRSSEVFRALFPNIPPEVVGPWGSLSRDELFGAEDACSGLIGAMESIARSTIESSAHEFKSAAIKGSIVPLHQRESSGRLKLVDLASRDIPAASQVSIMVIDLGEAFYAGADKREALIKIDLLLDAVGESLRGWAPCLAQLAQPSRLSRQDLSLAMALASRQEIGRASEQAPSAKRSAAL